MDNYNLQKEEELERNNFVQIQAAGILGISIEEFIEKYAKYVRNTLNKRPGDLISVLKICYEIRDIERETIDNTVENVKNSVYNLTK